MASSSTSFDQKTFKYDVFLSFRGEDTRKTFVDHLYHALESRSIITYKDDEKMEKGNRIPDELMGSIEESRFYIIVFSKNYASSSWCLDELVKIMECQKMEEHTAYPIFYDLEPTDIRKQTGPVKRAFAKHRNKEDAGKWRDALKQATSLAGWELKTTANGHEAKFIQEIVNKISSKLLCIDFSVDKNLVGLEGRVEDVISSLEIGVNDVRMIGIKGMGGAGKTTLARAIFDQISNRFEGSSFVENVKEVSNDSSKGLKSMQKQVLSDALNDQEINVSGVSDGKIKMKRRLRCKKVLVVLDDVDHMDQLEALAGELYWFKPGSRIIITTRDEKVLVAHRVNFIYNVNLLSDKEAICLFSRYAFRKDFPIQEYEELSQEVVRYAAGLPLTLKVLGSFLCDESDDVWRDALERLKTIPLAETLKILEISYNGLENDYKEIFLEVACILKGWKKDKAIKALESYGFRAKIGLRVLEQKSLITSVFGYLDMHDHLEEMGKNIVRRVHPNEPYKHSRLWIEEEIKDIIVKDKGTEATRCIYLWNIELHAATIIKGLRKMRGLRFLYIEKGYKDNDDKDCFLEDQESYDVSSEYLPDSLQYLHWQKYPLKCLPKNLRVYNGVQLQMANTNIKQLHEGVERKVLDKLKYLDLSLSKLETFDLGLTPNLETLILRECDNLVELLHMRNEASKLKVLDLSHSSVRIIRLGRTPNLEVLSLTQCDELEELHMPVGSVKLKSLDISHKKLRTLDIGKTRNLEYISIKGCGLVELHMPVDNLNLKALRLSESTLRILHLGPTPNLETLKLWRCSNLTELRMQDLDKLTYIDLYCEKLRTLDLGPTPNLETLALSCCYNLVELHKHGETPKLKSLDLMCNIHLKTIHLVRSPNLKLFELANCRDLEELHMPTGSVELKSLTLDQHYKLRTLDLSRTLNLEKLYIDGCCNLVEMHLPTELKSLCLKNSNLRTVDLVQIRNLEEIIIENCKDLVKLHMPVDCLKLKTFKLSNSKLRTLHLGPTPNLETLNIKDCYDLVELNTQVLHMLTYNLSDSNLRGQLQILRQQG